MKLIEIASKLITGKWMLPQHYHASLLKLVQHHMESDISYQDYPEERPETPTDEDYPVAVINVSGVLAKGVGPMEELLLGMTNVDSISDALDEAAADPNVQVIYLRFASPGGETTGIEELGRKIKAIDENVKPVFGWTEQLACSAAYWLVSQCRSIGMTPSAQVGSVGVYSLILNTTKQLRDMGVEVEAFYSGKYKMMGHDFRSLTDAERDLIQSDVEKQHQKFKDTVLSKRTNISEDDLEGLSFEGEDALSKGFVDSVHDSFEEFLAATVD